MTGQAVLYAAKSSEDTHGSIPTQLADGRALADREALHVVGEYSDEAASAYKGNRGTGLAQAMAHAERGECALIVQHSDRLARGDGKQAKHLVEYALWAIKAGVTIRSCQDDQTFGDLLYAVVTGQRNHEDSARKSKAVRSGLKRRAERGQPVGALPIGYRAEKTVEANAVVSRRVINPDKAPTVERIFQLRETGLTPGQISKRLNAEGATTIRGGPWQTRAVREVLLNEDYTGATGYPTLIEPERFQRVQAGMTRLDPAAVQARKGGRKARPIFLLGGGLAFCLACGGPMRSLTYWNGTRVYQCRNTREGYGTCSTRPLPALVVEQHVLDHLAVFADAVEDWLRSTRREAAAEGQRRQQQAKRQRRQLAELDQRRDRLLDDYERLLADDDPGARLVLERASRLSGERDKLVSAIVHADAVVAEWANVDTGEAVAFYANVADVVRQRLQRADGAEALNAALKQVVAGIWIVLDQGRLQAEFELRPDGPTSLQEGRHLFQHAHPASPDGSRIRLSETEHHTFV